MVAGVYILVKFVTIFIDVILFAMLIRAILSWFAMGNGQSPLGGFLFVITEPFILPVRVICMKFGWFQGTPLDFSFLITTLILSLLNLLLTGMIPV